MNADAFRPSFSGFGRTVGTVIGCDGCGHGSLRNLPESASVRRAYGSAADPVSLREEAGQIETADRALRGVEDVVAPGRVCDIGCWTGSFLVAASRRGWRAQGVEPSTWASQRARARGLDVTTAELSTGALEVGGYRLVATCDVLEHLADPAKAVCRIRGLLEPGGAFFLTVPDAGSRLARLMGRRWWSVLPMHLQYFTRASMTRLLESQGFEVRSVATHPKSFSARYYAERVGGYQPALGRAAVAALTRLGVAERPVAPDLRDRMAVIATVAPRGT